MSLILHTYLIPGNRFDLFFMLFLEIVTDRKALVHCRVVNTDTACLCLLTSFRFKRNLKVQSGFSLLKIGEIIFPIDELTFL